jgi:hypothetical protein
MREADDAKFGVYAIIQNHLRVLCVFVLKNNHEDTKGHDGADCRIYKGRRLDGRDDPGHDVKARLQRIR